MFTLIKKGWPLLMLLTVCKPNSYGQQPIIDRYIAAAFTSNEGLKQQSIQLDQSLNALKQAHTLFFPNVSLQGSYTRAAGGRTIDFPVGDLLNPVYSTLNQLTSSQSFPKVSNASFLLNPDNFYDAKAHTTLPLLNAEIYYNQKIKKVLIGQQQAAVNVYKRTLVQNIKEAYYRYYQATQAVAIYKTTLGLIKENVRVNTSLVKNGVRNNTVLMRAEAEQQKIRTSLTEAENNVANARLYFNFLLNRDGEAEIEIDTTVLSNTDVQATQIAAAGPEREELTQLNAVTNALTLNKQMQQAFIIPKVNTFLDLGSQAFKFKFDDKSRYVFWGLSLQWDLFSAGANKYKIQAAQYDVAQSESRYNNTRQALEMQAKQALNNYNTALAAQKNAITQYQFAERYYDDEMKLYKEGQALYLELVDALNQLTTARLQKTIANAAVLTALADVERQQATYPLQ